MATATEFEKIALSLEGAVAAPHFDRTSFKVKRIFATLAADGVTANLKLTPEEQELKCTLYPDALAPVDNAWGRQGWTTCQLSLLDAAELRAVLEMAWQHSVGNSRRRKGA